MTVSLHKTSNQRRKNMSEDKDISSVMEAAWNQTMGEETELLPEDFSHLGGEPPPADEPVVEVPAIETTEDTPDQEPVQEDQQAAAEVVPAQAAEPVQAPQHWSESDRSTFSKLNAEGQAFLLRRHKEMEADYTRKTQENAEAVKIGSTAMRNMDPAIQAEIRAAGITPDKFVENLIGYHRLSVQNPVLLIRSLTERFGLDPAQVFSNVKQPAPAPKQPEDPISARLQQLENFVSTEVRTREESMRSNAQQTVEQFSSEKDATGSPVRPHFEKVRTVMAKLMSVDPDLDLPTAYDVAVFRDPELRQDAVKGYTAPAAAPAPQIDLEKARRGQQAATAAKANIKGSGKPGTPAIAKPERMTLAQALSSAAEESGFR
jgi:hypothetical protein